MRTYDADIKLNSTSEPHRIRSPDLVIGVCYTPGVIGAYATCTARDETAAEEQDNEDRLSGRDLQDPDCTNG